MHKHLHCHITKQHLNNDNTLHVVGVVTNYAMWHSRYRLFREWVKEMEETPNVKLYLVEAAIGDRHFECTERMNPNHLQLRTNSEAWVKESMINLAVRDLLPRNWKYMAWCDTDISFHNRHWAQATLHQLQVHEVVQPFQQCADLGPNGEILNTFQSFGYMHQIGVRKQKHSKDPYQYAHSGYVWACTRRFFEALPGKGLLDCMILGSADYNMAWGMIGEIETTFHGKRHPNLLRRMREWAAAAFKQTRGDVGYVAGHIVHHFHGPKKSRHYETRDQILMRTNFDTDHDLGYDEQGLIRIFNNHALELGIKKYNRSRREDSVDAY